MRLVHPIALQPHTGVQTVVFTAVYRHQLQPLLVDQPAPTQAAADTLAGVRRHAIVGIVAVVAIVTPGGDPVSLFALSIPLCIFYEASIWIARLMLGRRAKNREATDTAA